MVRTVLWLVMGVIFLSLISGSVFSEDSLPLVDRLGLHINSHSRSCGSSGHSSLGTSFSYIPPQSTRCIEPTGDYSLSRFNFVVKREPFNLQAARDMSGLVSQGGSSILHASNDISLFHDFLSAGVQMVYREPFVSSNSPAPFTNRMGAQVVLKGTMSDMKYQAEYGYSGQETGFTPFATPNDQIGGKVAWEWKLPFVTPQIVFGRFTSNVDGDITRPQTVVNQQKFSLNWTIPDLPSLALSYGRQQTDIFARPEGPLSDAITTESLMADLSFQHTFGKGHWSSYYKTSTSDYWENGAQEEMGSSMGGTVHLLKPLDFTPQWGFTRRSNSEGTFLNDRFFAGLDSSVRMSPRLTLNPGFNFTRDVNRFDALQIDTLSAKLGYSYLASDDSVRVSILGQYILNQNSSTSTGPQVYDVSFLVKRNMQDFWNFQHRQQTLSLKIAHNQHVNALSPQRQSAQTSALVLVSIIP